MMEGNEYTGSNRPMIPNNFHHGFETILAARWQCHYRGSNIPPHEMA